MTAKRFFQFFLLFLAIASIAFLLWLLPQKNSPFFQPIENYELLTQLQQQELKEIDAVIKPYIGKSFWDIDLPKIQADLTRLDWIRSAEVKRKWPNLLYVSLKEQQAVARWGEDGLINGEGFVFFPTDLKDQASLVRLYGPLEESVSVLHRFVKLQDQLSAVDMLIEQFEYKNEIWSAKIFKGPEIIIDSTDYEDKVNRFIRAYPKIEKPLRNSARVYDLRYSNGFIIGQNQ